MTRDFEADDDCDECPAFPTDTVSRRGMSLRDYFAGQILIGFAATRAKGYSTDENVASRVWELADIVLKEREK